MANTAGLDLHGLILLEHLGNFMFWNVFENFIVSMEYHYEADRSKFVRLLAFVAVKSEALWEFQHKFAPPPIPIVYNRYLPIIFPQ
jgi:hypothetical protein